MARSAQHSDRWRPRQPLPLNIPAAFTQKPGTCGCQTRGVRHLAAGHQRERSVLRQPEQVFQPFTDSFFNNRRSGANGVHASVLVPGRSQPVRGQGRWKSPTYHPSIEAGIDGIVKTAGYIADQVIDHLWRIYAFIAPFFADAGAQLLNGSGGSNWLTVHLFQVLESLLQR